MRTLATKNTCQIHQLRTIDLVTRWSSYALPASTRVFLEPMPFSKTIDPIRTKREIEFATGRKCAAEILRSWNANEKVGVAEDRSPIWPEGFVGSISHSENWAWSAVAKREDLKSVGIDTEVIVERDARKVIEHDVATKEEWSLVTDTLTGLSAETIFTLVFSAKEAFYKCWSPITKKFFGFFDAAITHVDRDKLTIATLPANPNYFVSPSSLDVHYLINGCNVYTATSMNN